MDRTYNQPSLAKAGASLNQRVQFKLVHTLYAQSFTLAIAGLCGVAIAGLAGWLSGEGSLLVCAYLLGGITTLRLMVHRMAARFPRLGSRRLQMYFGAGAFAYAAAVGAASVIGLVSDAGEAARTLLLVYAMSYAFGLCAHNAARPMIAGGQLMLIVLPILAGCLYVRTPGTLALAFSIVLMIPAMGTVAFHTFRILRESMAAAEESAVMAERMQQLARTDAVTGLANRAGLDHALEERLLDLRTGQNMAIIWLDLDRFKEVNDLLGHPMGDRVLAEIARRLREVCPPEAVIARFGGDEFVVICEVADRRACEALAGKMRDQVTRPAQIDGERLDVPVSFGVAITPDDAADAATLMQRADLALFHAKASGRNRTCFYDPAMSRALVRRREIENELREALVRDELSIYFQPVVDLTSGRIRSFEALVRWFHPQKGELLPDEFIPVAEATGAIVTLGNWITAHAARICASWPEDVGISVNLSPLQARAPGAAFGILCALRDAGLQPSRLELEVTETLFLDDDALTSAFISELSAAGVRFALDDFGTGYSSLSSIQKFPFSTIKVDRSFVSGSAVGYKSDAIIRAVSELGSRLEMRIVAEGLETPEQVNSVRLAGCTLGQGYYFSRAVPEHTATLMLAEERKAPSPRMAG